MSIVNWKEWPWEGAPLVKFEYVSQKVSHIGAPLFPYFCRVRPALILRKYAARTGTTYDLVLKVKIIFAIFNYSRFWILHGALFPQRMRRSFELSAGAATVVFSWHREQHLVLIVATRVFTLWRDLWWLLLHEWLELVREHQVLLAICIHILRSVARLHLIHVWEIWRRVVSCNWRHWHPCLLFEQHWQLFIVVAL